ncbi:MAG TPA: DNA cytosine methyltransferase, partial [Streptosporangiaceae bacterium]
MTDLEVVEICAGAGGQALGLERAGFEHALAVELDASACATLRANRPGWKVAHGDVADPEVWEPEAYAGVDLIAGGVPCPPFTVAGRQLGATDERDLFAWAVELCGRVRPRALLLENVRGLSLNRFGAYRQHVLDRLR